MPQPEAKFKHKLVQSLEQHVPGAWYTYLSPGGAGQKPGLNDLLIGQRNGGPARPLLYVEAKMYPVSFTSTQLPTLNALQECGAEVRVVALDPSSVCPRRVIVFRRVAPWGVRDGRVHADFKTVSFWDFLWSAA